MPHALRKMMKFLADAMLGKLARELRMLGYDTLYYRGQDPRELIDLARKQERVILSRNTKLLAKRPEDRIIQIGEDKPLLQLKDLLNQGIICLNEKTLLSRCLLCNGLLDKVGRQAVEGQVPDYIFYHHEEFYRCLQCHHVYWPGSHLQRMKKRLKEMLRVQGVEEVSGQVK